MENVGSVGGGCEGSGFGVVGARAIRVLIGQDGVEWDGLAPLLAVHRERRHEVHLLLRRALLRADTVLSVQTRGALD